MRRAAPSFLASVLVLGLAGCAGTNAREAAPDATSQDHALADLVIYDRAATGENTNAGADAHNGSTLADLISTGKVTSIRVLGDSQTAGFNLEGYYDESDTGVVVYSGGEGTHQEIATHVRNWANLFREYAAKHGVESFVNAAVSGWRMEYLADEPSAWLGDGADAIVVMLGTNDAAHVSEEEFRELAERGLSACAEHCEHLVVVCPPANERTDATNRYGMDRIEEALRDVSEEHGWEYVSLLDAIKVGTGDFQEDQVHPTESGSEKLWQAFRERLSLPA